MFAYTTRAWLVMWSFGKRRLITQTQISIWHHTTLWSRNKDLSRLLSNSPKLFSGYVNSRDFCFCLGSKEKKNSHAKKRVQTVRKEKKIRNVTNDSFQYVWPFSRTVTTIIFQTHISLSAFNVLLNYSWVNSDSVFFFLPPNNYFPDWKYIAFIGNVSSCVIVCCINDWASPTVGLRKLFHNKKISHTPRPPKNEDFLLHQIY